jgi:uncharacterized protein (UPF0548 family)
VDYEAGSEEESEKSYVAILWSTRGKTQKTWRSKTVTVACKKKKKCYTAGVPSFVLYLCHFLWEQHKYILVTD